MDQNKNCLIVLPFDILAKKIAEIKMMNFCVVLNAVNNSISPLQIVQI